MKGSLKKVILELHRGGVCLAACVFELWYLVTQAWCVCGDPQIATVDREASSVLVPWVSSVLRFIPCPWHHGNRAWECAVLRLLTCKIQWTAQLQRPPWDRAAGVPPARDSVMTHHCGDEERQGEE